MSIYVNVIAVSRVTNLVPGSCSNMIRAYIVSSMKEMKDDLHSYESAVVLKKL